MSNYNYHQNTYYDYESSPDRYHNNYQHDAYAMHDMTYKQQQQDYYPSYESQHKNHQSNHVASEKFSRGNYKEKSGCCDMLCCGCCTCCPSWCRWISCILFLIIIALGVAIGILASKFKKPSVDFTGVQGSPVFGLTGTTVNMNFTLGFVVNNPNIESVTFKTLDATTYYHGDTTELGGGTLHDLHINSNSVTNISFPFNVAMDILSNSTQTVVKSILANCNAATDIQLDYKVVATVSIIGIPISVPFTNTINLACPLDSGTTALLTQIQSVLGALTTAAGIASTPTSPEAIASSISSILPSGSATDPTSLIPSGSTSDISSIVPSGVANAISSFV